MTNTYQQWSDNLHSLSRRAAGRLFFQPGRMRAFLLSVCQTASRSAVLPNHAKRAAVTTLIWLIGWSNLAAKLLPKLEEAMPVFSREEVKRLYADDPWVSNLLLNMWEYMHGETRLTSYPWNISLPIADVCNARCSFCTSWLEGRHVLDIAKLEAFAPILRHAAFVGLVGHGEPLAHPRFSELSQRLSAMLDPRARCYTITNGVFLEKWKHHLEALNVDSYSISLNAATPETHDEVMGLGRDAFQNIIESIRQLIALPSQSGRRRLVYITLVVTRQNLHELSEFVQLGNELNVTGIWFRTLLPQGNLIPGLNYHVLPPYLHPKFEELRKQAVEAILYSRVPVQAYPETWSQPIFSPRLSEQIEEQPPRLISRAEVLSDTSRRQKNDRLYAPAMRQSRGAQRPQGDFTSIEWIKGKLRLTTPSAQWAYAIQLPLKLPQECVSAVMVDVTLEHLDGRVGVGLLDTVKNAWIDRTFVDSAQSMPVRLNSSEGGPHALALVVENAQEGGERSTTTIARIHVSLLPHMVECREAVNWSDVVVNNAPDPLEDGLNPLNRTPRFACKAVYYNLYLNELFFRLNPCCYMTEVPGYEEVRFDGSTDFGEAWNSAAMIELRRRLRDGPLFGACKRCPEKW